VIENLTTRRRDEILRKLGIESHLTKVRIQEKMPSDEPLHQHLGIAYLPNGLKLHVMDSSTHIGEDRDVVIHAATENVGQVGYHLAARMLDQVKYDARSLIETYIKTKRHYEHGDFADYYKALLSVLQSLFGVSVTDSAAGWKPASLAMLFHSTADSYLAISTPWAGFLEAGLIHRALDESGEAGKRIYVFSDEIRGLAEQNERLHLEMMYTLLELRHGPVGMVITSKDLLAAGFDDSAEPQHCDYFDYL